jgi:hypothetical protein
VDIDPQAVEITMMSLYLKALEGEKSQLPPKQHILPELKYNIMCGNSLIGPDIYDQGALFAEDERDRINAFDWNFVPHVAPVSPPATGDRDIAATRSNRRSKSGAPAPSIGQVARSGGFDVVIGNPPYGAVLGEEDIAYLRKGYATATSELDTYGLFIEKATNVCKPQGRISMIIPTGWYSGVRFSSLRRFVACHTDPQVFVNLPYDVFEAWVDTTVFVGAKRAKPLGWPRRVPSKVTLRTFPKRHKIEAVSEFDEESKTVEFTGWFGSGGGRIPYLCRYSFKSIDGESPERQQANE